MACVKPICKKFKAVPINVKMNDTFMKKIRLVKHYLHINRSDLFRYSIDKLYCELMSKEDFKK